MQDLVQENGTLAGGSVRQDDGVSDGEGLAHRLAVTATVAVAVATDVLVTTVALASAEIIVSLRLAARVTLIT